MVAVSSDERRRTRISQMYRDLAAIDPDLLRRCVESATAISLNHEYRLGMTNDQRLQLGADIEAAMVSLALAACAKEPR